MDRLYNKRITTNITKELSREESALFGWSEEVENSKLLRLYIRTCFAVPSG